MLLVIDVGNTNIAMGVYDGDKLCARFRLATLHERSRDEYGVMIVNFMNHRNICIDDIEAVIIASVVPQVMYSLERAVKDYVHKTPVVVSAATDFGLKILTDNPSELGADRIVNAFAAYHKYKSPVIVVDFGTATTFCSVSGKGEYNGGVICSGIKISLDALFQKTSKLPRVEIVKPDRIIGKNTVSSMQAGIYYGYIGQVNYIVKMMKEEMGEPDAKVIATGGLARLISEDTEAFDYLDSNLTLDGLRLIYERNFK